MINCLLIAGEKSGEEHALSFIPEIQKNNPTIKFFGVGGDELQNQGVELLYHLKDFSSWGIAEVVHKIPFYLRAEKVILEEVLKRNCKTAILIDFQDFNSRLAKKLKKHNVKVLYYVAPQAWAWKAWRTKALSQNVHTLFTILPFEKKWFKDRGVNQVRGVVHPVLLTYAQEIKNLPPRPFDDLNKKINLLLLPGSRNFEVQNLLPIFLEAIALLKTEINQDIDLRIVRTNAVHSKFYDYYADSFTHIYDSNELSESLKWAHVSLAASGTVTLATALFEVPTIVSYKGSLLTEFIYNNFISYKGPISLANIVHEKILFPELIQHQVTPQILKRHLLHWLTNSSEYEKIKQELAMTKTKIAGDNFSVPEYMAQIIRE
jgi:lipid-A-disaccharide synthase